MHKYFIHCEKYSEIKLQKKLFVIYILKNEFEMKGCVIKRQT